MSPSSNLAVVASDGAGTSRSPRELRVRGYGLVAEAGTRLLAGPPASTGAECAASHLERLGTLELPAQEALRDLVRRAGLTGRGGGEFPLSVKLDTAAEAAAHAGRPLVVVNASEGEPASAKDRTLLELRPHLVLDGATVAARAVGAGEIVVYLHRGRTSSVHALTRALAERESPRLGRHGAPQIAVVDAPNRYVAGEASAVTAFLERGTAAPSRRRVPVAAQGVHGRPTVVSNAETYAHLALIARFGAAWFREAGSERSPGSTLVTMAGGVAVPGLVAEITGPTSFADLLGGPGGLAERPRALLLGGYGGTWLDGDAAWRAPLERGALSLAGARLGCGLVGVLPHTSCGLAETLRLVRYLGRQSAGQCGPCILGLPAMAELLGSIHEGSALRRDLRRLRQLAASIRGRGACGLPDGAVALVESALDVLADEVDEHRRRGTCRATRPESLFPVPGAASFPVPGEASLRGER